MREGSWNRDTGGSLLTWWIFPTPAPEVLASRLFRGSRRAAGLMARREAAAEKDGRAARAKEEMPLRTRSAPSQLTKSTSIDAKRGREEDQNTRLCPAVNTYLLNILPDDKERSDVGVE